MSLTIGSKAPLFKLLSESGKEISLKDFKNKYLVLYFYPRDNTPGCSIEAADFTKKLSSFKKLGAEVAGVSADSIESHKKFADKKKLKHLLLSDTEKKMIESYGVWRMKNFMGRKFMGIVRTTFLIDPDGKIAFIWDEVKVKDHALDVENKLKELLKN